MVTIGHGRIVKVTVEPTKENGVKASTMVRDFYVSVDVAKKGHSTRSSRDHDRTVYDVDTPTNIAFVETTDKNTPS